MGNASLGTGAVRKRLNTGALLMTVAAFGFIAYAAIFLVLNFTGTGLELGIGPEEVGATRGEIAGLSPSLVDYISHLHVAISAFMAGLGIAIAGLAWHGVRSGQMWAWTYAVAAAVVAVAVALPLHYPYGFATLEHLALIYIAVAVFVVGAALSYVGLRRMAAAGSASA